MKPRSHRSFEQARELPDRPEEPDKHIVLILEGAEILDVFELGLPFKDYFVETLECDLDGFYEIPATYKEALDEDADALETFAYINRHFVQLSTAWLKALNLIWTCNKILIRASVVQVTRELSYEHLPQIYKRIGMFPFIGKFGPGAEARLTVTGSQ